MEIVFKEHLNGFDKTNEYLYNKVLELKDTKSSKDFHLQWPCDTFSTLMCDYCLKKDSNFFNLKNIIETKVLCFAEEFGLKTHKVVWDDAWINLGIPGSFQEYHIHPNSHFSMVYYVKVTKNSGNTIFLSNNYFSDMYTPKYDEMTPANFSSYSIVPEESNLVLFRSNTPHMVSKNLSSENRVTLSANFSLVRK
jgi:uncharacterized protein (TIGR02466 family)